VAKPWPDWPRDLVGLPLAYTEMPGRFGRRRAAWEMRQLRPRRVGEGNGASPKLG